MKISLAIAVHNESENIIDCLRSCKNFVDEIVVVDGSSTDRTVESAQKEGAKVIVTDNPAMFHINKQKAIDACSGEWILQLDADERVTPVLAKEIQRVIAMENEEIERYQENLPERVLFKRYENISNIKNQKSKIQINNKNYYAFYIPRLNYFLGKYLRYGGVYPDGVIRLFRRGKARLPCIDVHELMEVDGKVGWLQNPLLHIDSPTFTRYLERNSRYIDHLSDQIKNQKSNIKMTKEKSKLFIIINQLVLALDYLFIKPITWFLWTTIRHKGILDGWQGIVFSFFSALRFPRAYWRAIQRRNL